MSTPSAHPMAVTCFIRYQIDPFERDAFTRYACAWGRIIPRCGGNLIGYFLPHERTWLEGIAATLNQACAVSP